MITTSNRIFVNPQFEAAFEDNFRNRAGLVDTMPGFIRNLLLRPVNPGDPYIVLTMWDSRAAFEAWVRSPEFVQGHARSGTLPKDVYSAPNQLELHQVILDSSEPDLAPEPKGEPFKMGH